MPLQTRRKAPRRDLVFLPPTLSKPGLACPPHFVLGTLASLREERVAGERGPRGSRDDQVVDRALRALGYGFSTQARSTRFEYRARGPGGRRWAEPNFVEVTTWEVVGGSKVGGGRVDGAPNPPKNHPLGLFSSGMRTSTVVIEAQEVVIIRTNGFLSPFLPTWGYANWEASNEHTS